MIRKFSVFNQDQLRILIGKITDVGTLPISLTDLDCEEGLTILLNREGARSVVMDIIEYLMDAQDKESLRIIRDLLFSLPLESTESTSCQ